MKNPLRDKWSDCSISLKENVHAIAGLSLAIYSLIMIGMFLLRILICLAAITLSCIGIHRSRKNNAPDKKLAVAGLVLSLAFALPLHILSLVI